MKAVMACYTQVLVLTSDFQAVSGQVEDQGGRSVPLMNP